MTYTVRVERQLIEWVTLTVNAKTPEEAERRAKREALKATDWQRVQTARRFKARVIVPPPPQTGEK
jgi:hypothetical protein